MCQGEVLREVSGHSELAREEGPPERARARVKKSAHNAEYDSESGKQNEEKMRGHFDQRSSQDILLGMKCKVSHICTVVHPRLGNVLLRSGQGNGWSDSYPLQFKL